MKKRNQAREISSQDKDHREHLAQGWGILGRSAEKHKRR